MSCSPDLMKFNKSLDAAIQHESRFFDDVLIPSRLVSLLSKTVETSLFKCDVYLYNTSKT